MKLAITADVHLHSFSYAGGAQHHAGINARARLVLDTLEDALQLATREGCTHFAVLGDLFDVPRPDVRLVAELMRLFAHYRSVLRFVLLKGNHDEFSSLPRDNALACFAHPEGVLGFDCVVVDSKPYRLGPWLFLPFKSINTDAGETLLEHIEREVVRAGSGVHALLGHFGLYRNAPEPWMLNATNAVSVSALAERLEPHCTKGLAIVAGDWHKHASFHELDDLTQRDALFVGTQVGALAPTGWNNPGLDGYGSVLILSEDGALTRHEVPGPRFLNVHGSTWPVLSEHTHHRLYVRWHVATGALQEAMAQRGELQKLWKLEALEVHTDTESAERAAESAATAARSALTLDQALVSYVDKLELPVGLERARVLDHAKRVLNAAQKEGI